jgi:hypothetical protein
MRKLAFFVAKPEDLTADVCREALLHPKTLPPTHDWFDRELKSLTGIDVLPTPSEARQDTPFTRTNSPASCSTDSTPCRA